jgi:hypothetical protein
MGEIIPRWEWRTFGESFGESETIIKGYEAKVRESSEIYILSAMSNDNTKVRDMLMDIKYLVQTNADKLEQWNPLIKASFPISLENLTTVAKSWKVDISKEIKEGMTYEEFLAMVNANSNLKAVDVFKNRHGFKINNCIVELAYLKFDGKPINTVAVEHEDPALVYDTVKMLKLDKYENINYLRALKNSVGLKY